MEGSGTLHMFLIVDKYIYVCAGDMEQVGGRFSEGCSRPSFLKVANQHYGLYEDFSQPQTAPVLVMVLQAHVRPGERLLTEVWEMHCVGKLKLGSSASERCTADLQ